MSRPVDPFVERMREAAQPEIAIATFAHYYEQLRRGGDGLIAEAEIESVTELPSFLGLPASASAGLSALPATVVIKLNGGLATSMGMSRAKSLLVAKGGLTFLDIIARQLLWLRDQHACRLPLLLMNSFRTRSDTLAHLAAYDLDVDLPLDFMQHRVPKVRASDLAPALWPADPGLEWCPPGHGDLYAALLSSGALDLLLAAGYRFAFVSNADNLGATLDLSILGWFALSDLAFAMEVADRCEADRKGGHLARRADGRLLLRERAQCPADDLAAFEDWQRHRFFNTNNLWLDLAALHDALRERGGVLGLPMIRNVKPIDPSNPDSPLAYQLETAMGSAIAAFERAGAIHVPRSRFLPVKTTSDLLVLRSDAFTLDDRYQVTLHPHRTAPPIVELDDCYYRFIGDFEARFPCGPPSLLHCERLSISGDLEWSHGVSVAGRCQCRSAGDKRSVIPSGAVLAGDIVFS
ncbi:MAG: UTP--glucose-1-phosphate uridylyltransferase [Candidatus Schekmanbacteria bacterium]|nr:UTP--glucose-1-phosphate uridylyltransferase [Candidatus Schekmanbacteria bacterium]